jgi:NAD(P)-dependent dehydrogenase (short-subunit alcohol dehydrogenase family)
LSLTYYDSDTNPEALDEDMLNSFRVNTLGLLHSIQAFLPLIRKGTIKKVVNISTGMADLDVINGIEIDVAGPYSASKAAANVVIAKYNAAHKNEGILFLSISPGYVATERNFEAAESKCLS